MAEMDLEFTMNEIDELLAGIDDGANRTSEIVKVFAFSMHGWGCQHRSQLE